MLDRIQIASRPDDLRLYPGDIVYITTMGQPTVILGSASLASDLLDARGRLPLFSTIPLS